MHTSQAPNPSVAILTSSVEHQQLISDLLCETGLDVTLLDYQSQQLLQDVQQSNANVLLVDIAEDTESGTVIIDTLLEEDSLPILFNDSSPTGAPTDKVWAKLLSRKLTRLAEQHLTRSESSENGGHLTEQAEDLETELSADHPALNVWVLAASLGGPEAVEDFLAAINPELPVAFLLAQHIGASHTESMAKQLDSATAYSVFPAQTDHLIQHHEVIVIPADQQISITDQGVLNLNPAPAAAVFSPNINQILNAVVAHYTKTSGIIFFSGIGNDGVRASKGVAGVGGQVWAQTADSCVVSNLPDKARKAGVITFNGTPTELAEQLNHRFSG